MSGLHSDALGLYISIPFCRSKCTYCNFASGVYPARRTCDAMWTGSSGIWRRPGSGRRGWAWSCRAAWTRFTWAEERPACWRRSCWRGCLGRCGRSSTLSRMPRSPWSARRGSLRRRHCRRSAAGVNRVSLGVQSFIDREAQVSGRLHSRAVVEEDVRRLRGAGIANLNVDLIAGLAGQTSASWEESLAALAESGVPHASVYMLEVDEDSRLGREVLAGGARYHAELVPGRRCDGADVRGGHREAGAGGAGAVRDFELLPAGICVAAQSALLAAAALPGAGAGCVFGIAMQRTPDGARLTCSVDDHRRPGGLS